LYARPSAIWWVNGAHLALEIKRQCEAEHTSDIVNVACGLSIVLTSNDVAIERAQRAIACINARLAEAKDAGLLRVFNAKLASLRQAARRETPSPTIACAVSYIDRSRHARCRHDQQGARHIIAQSGQG
jgi:hypothetical protein